MHFLIVDDDFNLRAGAAQTLRDFYPDSIVHEAPSIAAAQRLLNEQRSIDLVLLDLNLEDSRGIDTLKALRDWCEAQDRNPRIVVVSAGADYDDTLIQDAIENCATGFITKGTRADLFRAAIDMTLAGSIYVPQRYLDAKTKRRQTTQQPDFAVQIALTPREEEIADWLVKGLSYKMIARESGKKGMPITENTARAHTQNIHTKLRMASVLNDPNLPPKTAVVTAYAAGKLKLRR